MEMDRHEALCGQEAINADQVHLRPADQMKSGEYCKNGYQQNKTEIYG